MMASHLVEFVRQVGLGLSLRHYNEQSTQRVQEIVHSHDCGKC